MNYSTFHIDLVLDKSLQYIKGIGPKRAEAFRALGYEKVRDVMQCLPYRYLDRRKMTQLNAAQSGQILSQIVKVEQIVENRKQRKSWKIICSDGAGMISLVYFHITRQFLEQFKIGAEIAISGKVVWHFGELRMLHPDIAVSSDKASEALAIEPVYPASAHLSSRNIASTMKEILKILPQVPEWLPSDIIREEKFPSWNQAMQILHCPQSDTDLATIAQALARLEFEELQQEKMLLEQSRARLAQTPKPKIEFSGTLQASLISTLPFHLTDDQQQALREIESDQRSEKHMLRLLQGDVGSGKTIVALLSILNVVEAGFQGIFMAPTTILARQHYESCCRLLKEQSGVCVQLLISGLRAEEKRRTLANSREGAAQVIIGTHALIQDSVQFYKPGLVVIDEQHRFGVKQRLELFSKGLFCDLLMMSATPIPRTLNMIYRDYIAISKINNKPAGRLPILTTVMSAAKILPLIAHLKIQISQGAKVYWICPLIEESEVLRLRNAEERYVSLRQTFGDVVGLVHGKVNDKEKVLAEFASSGSQLKILVATTVIEVGVDVPEATIIVIENAERFGLTQLHQLRGRVGRSNRQSYCVLLYSPPLSNIAQQRLQIMKSSQDGFHIAEEDLRIRGGGKVLGVEQSGLTSATSARSRGLEVA